MNRNDLIDELKKRIGLNRGLAGLYSDNILSDSINTSLREFSRFCGFTINIHLDMVADLWASTEWNMTRTAGGFTGRGTGVHNNTIDAYLKFPAWFMNMIEKSGCSIKRVYPEMKGLYPQTGRYAGSVKNDMMFFQAANFAHYNYDPPVFEFRAPDTIVIKAWDRAYYAPVHYWIHVECTHALNLSTITVGLEEMFKDLCEYDIRINLFSELGQVKVDVGNATLDLNLDKFASADSDKAALVEKMTKRSITNNIELRL